jgi:hypothetical protein
MRVWRESLLLLLLIQLTLSCGRGRFRSAYLKLDVPGEKDLEALLLKFLRTLCDKL